MYVYICVVYRRIQILSIRAGGNINPTLFLMHEESEIQGRKRKISCCTVSVDLTLKSSFESLSITGLNPTNLFGEKNKNKKPKTLIPLHLTSYGGKT